jgi:hypothetical protein
LFVTYVEVVVVTRSLKVRLSVNCIPGDGMAESWELGIHAGFVSSLDCMEAVTRLGGREAPLPRLPVRYDHVALLDRKPSLLSPVSTSDQSPFPGVERSATNGHYVRRSLECSNIPNGLLELPK